MSCKQCNLHKGGFKTENEFSDFEALIATLVESDMLSELGRNLGARFYEIRYKCKACNALWLLSFPDQAYRGEWHEV